MISAKFINPVTPGKLAVEKGIWLGVPLKVAWDSSTIVMDPAPIMVSLSISELFRIFIEVLIYNRLFRIFE